MSYNKLNKGLTDIYNDYVKFLDSDEFEVDLDSDRWKSEHYPLPDELAEIDASAHGARVLQEFDYVSQDAFRDTRSRRTAYAPGMYGDWSSRLATQTFK